MGDVTQGDAALCPGLSSYGLSGLMTAWAIGAFLLMVMAAQAQPTSATSISFQGALTAAGGQPLANGNYHLTFKFYTNAITATALATSSVPNVPITNGLASTPIPVDAVWFDGSTRYLGIAINGGTELSPRVLITAVPYALSAMSLGAGVFAGTNGFLGVGTLTPNDRLEVYNGNITLRRFDEYPTDARYVRFATRSTTGGSMQDWAFAAEPMPGRYNFDQNVCDLWIGNRIDDASWAKRLAIGKAGDLGLLRLGESEQTDQTIYWRTRNQTGASFQDWVISASIIPGRFNVDQNICDFWIGNRIDAGAWQKLFYITKNGNVGIQTTSPQAALDVNGTTRTRVLQITGGADLAEHLSVTDANPRDEFKVEAGMVVSIDPSGNRRFKLSDEAYDRKRVGIISGGNGVQPGLVLRDEGNPRCGWRATHRPDRPGLVPRGCLLRTHHSRRSAHHFCHPRPRHESKRRHQSPLRRPRPSPDRPGRGPGLGPGVGGETVTTSEPNFMKTALGTICIALFLWETTTRNAFSQDFDQDGVPDAVENQLLSTLAPVVYADQSNDKPPLTLDYYVRHCRLYWYTAPFGMEVGNTGDTPETVDLMLGQIALHKSQSLNYHYALHFRVGNWNIGQDPNEPITWASLQAAQRGVYGRVDPIAPGRYRVQYFLVFGFNNTSAPDFCGDVEPGSHEGDWISVDFLVEATDLNHPRIYDAVYHNHGRQIFVESPSALTFEGSHPVVYLERGDQETWPRVLTAGFVNWDIQPCVSANKIFHAEVVLGFSFGGEEGTYPVVRPHLGQGPRFLVTTVKNVGNKAHYGSDVEARFFHEFAGWYGTEYERDCSSVPILETEPPSGPVFQDKIWDRAFDTTRAWQTWKGQPNVFVNFTHTGPESGSVAQPFSKLSEALPVVVPNGTININAGGSGEVLTIFEPCTLTAPSGMVTIGQ